MEEFFLEAAAQLPQKQFLLGGNGWEDKPKPDNVRYVGHVYTEDHNALNSTAAAVLNINRASMARYGFSPPTRVFEAAGAAACLITDEWLGIELFLQPGSEVLVARSGADVAAHLDALSPERARKLGEAAQSGFWPNTPTRTGRWSWKRRWRWDRAADGSAARRGGGGVKPRALRFVILGLSITSSWGNGHATTFRGLVKGLTARGHDVLFLERDVEWYASNRDMPRPPFGRTELYASVNELQERFGQDVARRTW